MGLSPQAFSPTGWWKRESMRITRGLPTMYNQRSRLNRKFGLCGAKSVLTIVEVCLLWILIYGVSLNSKFTKWQIVFILWNLYQLQPSKLKIHLLSGYRYLGVFHSFLDVRVFQWFVIYMFLCNLRNSLRSLSQS